MTSLHIPLLTLLLTLSCAAQTPGVRVPFVGCSSDGQTGPEPAPSGHNKLVHISPEAARRLAYYRAQFGPGVLAPIGWSCFGVYGSNGTSLYVTPEPHTPDSTVFSDKWKGFDGFAIQLSDMSGGTSGRFDVARTIARVFPAHRQFLRDVIKEGLRPASDFTIGPYPDDHLTYKSKELVEYETPPNHQGLGTDSRLLKNGSPIQGLALLSGADTDCTTLATRLPTELRDLTPVIIHQVELDYR